MIKNNFKTAWRNLVKNKFYTGIGILGLTLGLTVGIFILIWVKEELNYNDFAGKSQILKVNSNVNTGNTKQTWTNSPGPVAVYAKEEVPGVINAVRLRGVWRYSIFSQNGSDFKAEKAVFVDPDFFRMFSLELIHGNPKKIFPTDNSIVLSASTAKKYFGDENPVGKTIQADHQDNYTVVGVVEDPPVNSSLDFKVFFPLSIITNEYSGEGYWKSLDSDWGNFNYFTFLRLSKKTSPKDVVDQLSKIYRENDPGADQTMTDAYVLQPISELKLYRPDGSPGNIQTVRIFIIVAILILLIASINYINLSTARAIQRAKEVSIRKIIGAGKKQLFFQFISESVLFFFIALVLAIGLLYLLNPYFNELSGKQIQFNLLNWRFWKLILFVFLGTLVASSVYPALLLTSFKPLQAVKGKILPGIGAASFRKVLLTIQFVFSVVLIIGTLVIGRQLEFLRTKDPGYNRSQVITLDMREEMQKHSITVKTEIEKLPGVESVAFASRSIVNNGTRTGDVNWKTKNPQNDFVAAPLGIDENFIPLMEMELVAGHNFAGSKADSTHFILNETAVAMTGMENPVGKRFTLWETKGTIIGVVKDFNFSSLRNKIDPSVIYYNPEAYRLYIKSTGNQVSSTIASLEEIWKKYNTGFPFDYSFLDEDYARMYQRDERTGQLFNIFSIIAIFVSCLGLFGLATYSAQLKTKEIGIRKVLGASIFQITRLLSIDFLKLVFISTIIATPLAWFLMSNWLQNFAYKTNLSWWIFALAGFLALTVAFLTVGFQAIKAALQNPVKSLRTE